MRVMIQLREDAATELHKTYGQTTASLPKKAATTQLLKAVEKLGGKIEPVHPGQTHPLLVPFFMIEVTDQKSAEKIISRLQKFDIVEAAYLGPDDELP